MRISRSASTKLDHIFGLFFSPLRQHSIASCQVEGPKTKSQQHANQIEEEKSHETELLLLFGIINVLAAGPHFYSQSLRHKKKVKK